jgi:formylglycine-generating enzyme required for sulfatase activity
MKLILNQCFPLKTTNERPERLKKTDSEFTLFLATDVLTNEETRQEILDFLETAFQKKALTAAKWANHVLHLTRTHGMRESPSFVLIQWTDPVQIWMYGRCQVVHVRSDKTFTIFKPDAPNQWYVLTELAELNSHWLMCREDSELIEPIADALERALAQTQYPLEVFFYNLNFPKAHKQAVTVVRVEAIVDLDAPIEDSILAQQVATMAKHVRPDTKKLIDKFLGQKVVNHEFWTGRVEKVEYEAVLSNLELKKKEIELLRQQTHLARASELETMLLQKQLEINELQTKIATLTQQVGMMELIQKGAAATQKELDDLKLSFKKLTLEKTQLVQQLKEAQSLQNQSVTREESLSKQLTATKSQLETLQKEKHVLQKAQEETAKSFLHKSNDLERLQKEKELLQQVQNQAVTQQDGLSNQLKVAQTEKEYLQRVQNQAVAEKQQLSKQLQDAKSAQNQSVAQNDHLSKQLESLKTYISKLESANAELQQVHNQSVAQNEALFKIGQDEILRLQKLLDLKGTAEKLKPIVIPTPIVPKPIIVTQPTVKPKLPFEPEMILVEGGTFKMGRDVTLSSYAIGKYPITQAQWQAVMGANPSHFKGDNLPVESVNWDDAQKFISKLNSMTGKTYSLPTEAQWEFAARGGTESKGFEYSGSNNLDEVGWYRDNSDSKTHPVGEKEENELGIHDMSGNVWEWCADWYGSYDSVAVTNPIGAVEGAFRVLRGGGCYDHSMNCRVASRDCNAPSLRSLRYGFRVVSFP